MNYQIAISGNVGVGKSTLGPIIASAIDAPWLPETAISDIFPHLIADQTSHSKLVTELVFPTVQIASILSHFLAGHSVVFTERSVWDHMLFYKFWKHRFGFDNKFDELMHDLLKTFQDHPVKYEVLTIFLRCDCEQLAIRTASRGQAFDSTFNADVLSELHNIYETALSVNPPNVVGTYDVSSLDIKNKGQLQAFINSIVDDIMMNKVGEKYDK